MFISNWCNRFYHHRVRWCFILCSSSFYIFCAISFRVLWMHWGRYFALFILFHRKSPSRRFRRHFRREFSSSFSYSSSSSFPFLLLLHGTNFVFSHLHFSRLIFFLSLSDVRVFIFQYHETGMRLFFNVSLNELVWVWDSRFSLLSCLLYFNLTAIIKDNEKSEELS
jgi:hypothetical protein